MTYYAVFDESSADPKPVTGWINTDFADYVLPADGLLILDSSQWASRMVGQWAIMNGALYRADIDVQPSPEILAQTELNNRLAQGVVFHSSETAVDGVKFALNQVTLNQIGSVARDYAAGLGLPNDVNVFGYPDYDGNVVQMNGAEVVEVYRAMRDLVSSLNQQAAAMAQDLPPQWPSQSVEI